MLGTLAGNTRNIVDSETVCLPSKTRRGATVMLVCVTKPNTNG